MLIELRHGARKGPVPIVGSVDQSVPTSGDVHLYSDPETFLTDNPILYADCEGLEGRERTLHPGQAQAQVQHEYGHTGIRTSSFQKKIRKKHHSSKRDYVGHYTRKTDPRICRDQFISSPALYLL
jgi:hypothetical protein